jgi:hypothetical protein
VTATRGRSPFDSIATARGEAAWEWFATEVPGIVAGLRTTGSISPDTAVDADRLIGMGKYDRALTLVLEEATRLDR